jgi:hypothetical protein
VSNSDLSVIYGDDVVAYDVVSGLAVVTCGTTIYMDADGIAKWNELVYGSANPAAGTKPLRTIRPLGSYEAKLTQKDPETGIANGNEFLLEIPGVKWAIPDAPGANPQGGSSEIALSGAMRKVSGSPAYRISVTCDDVAYA